jgi:hypothetical protein
MVRGMSDMVFILLPVVADVVASKQNLQRSVYGRPVESGTPDNIRYAKRVRLACQHFEDDERFFDAPGFFRNLRSQGLRCSISTLHSFIDLQSVSDSR